MKLKFQTDLVIPNKFERREKKTYETQTKSGKKTSRGKKEFF